MGVFNLSVADFHLGTDTHLELSAHILRHTSPTNLVRSGNDLVLVAEIAGHKRLETTRRYSLPSAEDREIAMESYELSTSRIQTNATLRNGSVRNRIASKVFSVKSI